MEKKKAATPAKRQAQVPGTRANDTAEHRRELDHFVNFVTTEAKPLAAPISYNGTSWTATDGSEYEPFVAPDDNLFSRLVELGLLSSTHDACIRDKVFYIIGEGLLEVGKTKEDFPPELDGQVNANRETLDDCLEQVADNLERFGNAFVEILWIPADNAGGTDTEDNKGKATWAIYVQDVLDCRLAKPEAGKAFSRKLLISKEFRKNGYVMDLEKNVVEIPLYLDDQEIDDNWTKPDEDGIRRTALHLRSKKRFGQYGLPGSFSGFIPILLEHKINQFNLDNFQNNLFLASIISIMGSLSPAEQKAAVKNIRAMYSGEGKAMRAMIIASEQKLDAVKVDTLNQKVEGHFQQLDDKNSDKIILAHNWSRQLLDTKVDAGLGRGGSYIRDLFKLKFRTVINPLQRIVLNNFVFPFFKAIDEIGGTKYYDQKWTLVAGIPPGFEGEIDVNAITTVNEAREQQGKPALPTTDVRGNKMVKEVGGKPVNADSTNSDTPQ